MIEDAQYLRDLSRGGIFVWARTVHPVGTGIVVALTLPGGEEHRGGIEVSSRVGRGTRAHIWIPVVGRASTRPPGATARASTIGGATRAR